MRAVLILAFAALAACSSLLPRAQQLTYSPWQSFAEAQQTFDRIVPHRTTVAELKQMKLDPKANPNIAILNYSDILRRFLPSPSISAADLDARRAAMHRRQERLRGLRDQPVEHQAQALRQLPRRPVQLQAQDRRFRLALQRRAAGRGGVVIYKLTGGQPAIHEYEESVNPLGPFQSGAT